MVESYTLVRGALALVFATAGGSKIAGLAKAKRQFRKRDYPRWMRHAVGTAEIAGAALLGRSSTAPVGAALLATLMPGAIITHLATRGERAKAVVPLAVLAALLHLYRTDPPEWRL